MHEGVLQVVRLARLPRCRRCGLPFALNSETGGHTVTPPTPAPGPVTLLAHGWPLIGSPKVAAAGQTL